MLKTISIKKMGRLYAIRVKDPLDSNSRARQITEQSYFKVMSFKTCVLSLMRPALEYDMDTFDSDHKITGLPTTASEFVLELRNTIGKFIFPGIERHINGNPMSTIIIVDCFTKDETDFINRMNGTFITEDDLRDIISSTTIDPCIVRLTNVVDGIITSGFTEDLSTLIAKNSAVISGDVFVNDSKNIKTINIFYGRELSEFKQSICDLIKPGSDIVVYEDEQYTDNLNTLGRTDCVIYNGASFPIVMMKYGRILLTINIHSMAFASSDCGVEELAKYIKHVNYLPFLRSCYDGKKFVKMYSEQERYCINVDRIMEQIRNEINNLVYHIDIENIRNSVSKYRNMGYDIYDTSFTENTAKILALERVLERHINRDIASIVLRYIPPAIDRLA